MSAFHRKVDTNKVYNALCRGDVKSLADRSKLKCFLKPTSIPIYKGKEEVVNYIPRVSQFHDVISDSEIAYIKEHAQKLMQMSLLLTRAQNREVTYIHTVSHTAWFKDNDYRPLYTISRRISIITGLQTTYRAEGMSDVEPYQALNYGIGGMYTPHIDFQKSPLWGPSRKNQSSDIIGTGDRIATWMFYLNSVKAGGATVFPKLGVRVPAEKGSAVFWYNLLPNGNPDTRTLHAGCPVLLGSKWVVNKWIRQHGQALTTLCRRKYEEEFAYEYS